MLELRDRDFDGSFPFTPHYRDVHGVALHYVDEGAGEPILLLHGDPTWGYLYRRFVPPLARCRRVLVPDQMGMGKSAVPAERALYRLEQHIANLEALLLGLDLHDLTLVLHDWGGPVGLGFAVQHAKRVKRLVLLNTWAFAPWPGGAFPRLIELIRSDRGDKFVLDRHGYLEPALLGTPERPRGLDATALEAYRAPYPTPASRLALLSWSRDIPVAEDDPSWPAMKRIEAGLARFAEIPVLLVWGMRDPVLPPAILDRWRTTYPRASVRTLEKAGHFLQEDAPDEIVAWTQDFLEENR